MEFIQELSPAISGYVTELNGGWNMLIIVLVIAMVIDFISGILLAGVFAKSGKTEKGRIKSSTGFIGVSKKVMVLFLVMISYGIDLVVGTDFICNGVIVAYIIIESVSIVENAGMMGVPIPAKLKQGIELLKDMEE